MADTIRLNRINKWNGGITINDRDLREGVCLNAEEVDIFSNPGFIQPETILAANSTDNGNVASGTPRRIWAYTADNAGRLWALSDDAAATPKAKIWKIASAGSNTSAGNYVATLTSAQDARGSNYVSNMSWHGTGDPIDKAYLYFIVGTNSLYRTEDIMVDDTPDSEDSVGTLSNITATSKYIPMIRVAGELFIGNGQFVNKVDGTGVYVTSAFTLPNGWSCVDFAPLGDELLILAESVSTTENTSKVFFWDMTATTGIDNEVTIPMGGPQSIVNHGETIRIFCAKNGNLRIYELNGLMPLKTHEIDCYNEASMNNDSYIIYPNSVFVKDNILYFGLSRSAASDDSGLYALGRTIEGGPLALVLAKRFSSTASAAGKSHHPFAAKSAGPNIFVSYCARGASDVNTIVRVEEMNSPTRSSTAVYESIYIDGGRPETVKDWIGFRVVTKPIPTGCTITVDARTDNATSYDSNSSFALTSSNDQTHEGTAGSTDGANTFWSRSWTSVVGRAIQVRISFTSSSTSKASIYFLSLLSREQELL